MRFDGWARHTKSTNGIKVGGETLAENEGNLLVLGGVGDGVGLASDDT